MERPFSIIDYYRQRAPEYEQIYYRDIPQKRKELAEEAARLESLAAGGTVLELACGTGYWTEVISRSAKLIVASDISSEMIEEARKKDYRCPVHFVRTDLYRAAFAAGSFDLLTMGFWFSHEPKQNYAEFHQLVAGLVKPDGLIWMIDNNPPAEGPRMESVGTDSHGNNYKKRYLDSGKEFVILKNYFGPEELRGIFEPRFAVRKLIFNECYWSVVLGPK
ncbi:MAG: class I SAM-dependent methyltransferase [Candidatus Zixiibacteriota bacterium]|nr:MAG: class I SAM-dependent methyltransferase [candidate division Zixibacteria bacterium]